MIARIRHLAPHILAAGAVLVVAGLAWTLVRGQLELVGEIALALGLVAVAAYVALEPARVRSALTGRTARQGGNAMIVSLAVVGILVLLNFLAARHHKRFDLTAEGTFSLSPQTLQVLSSLQDPVAVTAFMTPNYYAAQDVEDLLKEYTYHSDKIQFKVVDPEQQPALARQNNVTSDGTIVFQDGDRQQTTLGSDEQSVTSALVKLTRDEAKTVYFLTGHKERDPQDNSDPGYSSIADALGKDSYQVQSLNLSVTSAVPDDAAALVIAAPMVAPSDQEIQAINDYVDRGGSLFVLGDPSSDVTLDGVLSRWGLSLRKDIAVDPQAAFFGDLGTPVISRYPYHDITKDLAGLTTFYPLASSIATQSPSPDGVSVSPLVQTSASSWGETDTQSQQVQMDQGTDVPGPLDLAVAATWTLPTQGDDGQEKHARLVLFGDADLVANDMLQAVQGNTGNADLFLNATSWLAEEESLISIRATQPTTRTVVLTPPQIRMVMYTSLIFLPGIVIVAGAWVWWRRR